MLAKFFISLPFDFVVPDNEKFKTYPFQHEGYELLFEPPVHGGAVPSNDIVAEFSIDEKAALQANVLAVTFKKDSFTRKRKEEERKTPFGGMDPSKEVVEKAVKGFLEKFKYVAKSHFITPGIKLDEVDWHLAYLNDDGSALEPDGYLRGLRSRRFNVNYTTCDQPMWDFVHSLPEQFAPPSWSLLLLDARSALPHIGSAIVLTATALEVFIAEVLSTLVPHPEVPSAVWEWITEKEKKWQVPDVEEKYDSLLKILTGRSLKDQADLWKAFQNIRTARNNFVHYGVPRISKNSAPLSVDDVSKLMRQADDIVTTVRAWLPADKQWPVHTPTAKVDTHFVLPADKRQA